MTFNQIISGLNKLGDKDKKSIKEKKFGIVANNSLGIYHKEFGIIPDREKKHSCSIPLAYRYVR